MPESSTASTATASDQRSRSGVLVHLLSAFFGGILFAPLIAGAVYRLTDDEFTKANARNAFNWWLPVSVLSLGVVAFVVIVGAFPPGGLEALVLYVIIVPLVSFALAIFAALVAYNGNIWKYPLAPNIL